MTAPEVSLIRKAEVRRWSIRPVFLQIATHPPDCPCRVSLVAARIPWNTRLRLALALVRWRLFRQMGAFRELQTHVSWTNNGFALAIERYRMGFLTYDTLLARVRGGNRYG
jgi:hypothetical protein